MPSKPAAGSETALFQPSTDSLLALDYVNEDLLIEIFLLLPVKTLIRFKAVCKEWLSLISSDHFCHRHTLRRPKLQRSLILQMHNLQFFYFNQNINGEKVVMIPYSLSVPDHQILHECNGLLLLEYECSKYSYYVYNPTTKELETRPRNSYYVYNPTTKRSRKIVLTHSDKYTVVAAVNLAFDPSSSPYYKIVCIRSMEWCYDGNEEDVYVYQIEVYDSQSHRWKLVLEPFATSRISGGVHWKNSIYWRSNGESYCRFDIGKNETRKLSFPMSPHPPYIDRAHHLQESNGHLYHFSVLKKYKCEDVVVAVWELGGDDHDPKWLLQHLYVTNTEGIWPVAVRLMGGSDGDGDGTCSLSLLIYEAKKMKVCNFGEKNYEDLVDFTNHAIYKPDKGWVRFYAMKGFLFGEILALV